MTDAVALKAAGAVALSDDGRHAMDRAMLGRALEAAAAAGLPVLIHAQAEGLGNGPDAEAAALTDALDALRNIKGARLHVQHVSTRQAVELIRAAKADGLAVTAEATPHHLPLTSRDAAAMGPHGNVNPPLRTAEKLKYLAGCEQGAGTFISDTLPEESAAALREAIARAA